jgi:hypothetical protein
VSCAGGAHSDEDNQDYDDNDGKDEDPVMMTTVMTRTTASPIMLPVMTRSLMTTTANVIHIVIPNSSIVCYWKMKNPLNPIG